MIIVYSVYCGSYPFNIFGWVCVLSINHYIIINNIYCDRGFQPTSNGLLIHGSKIGSTLIVYTHHSF